LGSTGELLIFSFTVPGLASPLPYLIFWKPWQGD